MRVVDRIYTVWNSAVIVLNEKKVISLFFKGLTSKYQTHLSCVNAIFFINEISSAHDPTKFNGRNFCNLKQKDEYAVQMNKHPCFDCYI